MPSGVAVNGCPQSTRCCLVGGYLILWWLRTLPPDVAVNEFRQQWSQRFGRDSFHSLITALSLSRNGVVRQCGVVDLARFAQSGLLRSRFACFLPIAAIAPICVPPHLGSALHRSRGNTGIRRRWRGRTALGSACDGDSIGATFGRQSRTFRAGGPARMAFAGHGGSRYPAETRCARLQALLCADRTS